MLKSQLTPHSELTEKKPSKHTNKLHQIVLLKAYKGFDVYTKRAYTYFCYKTKENTYYPAANSNERNTPAYLDGLVGTIKLSELKKNYILTK